MNKVFSYSCQRSTGHSYHFIEAAMILGTMIKEVDLEQSVYLRIAKDDIQSISEMKANSKEQLCLPI